MSIQFALQLLTNPRGHRNYWTDFVIKDTAEAAFEAFREAEAMGYRAEDLRVVAIQTVEVDRVGPADQWWCINGAELMAALTRAHDGDRPDVVYLELIANSETEQP